METQHRQHPPALHLAALALGKLKPDVAAKIQSHLDEGGDCRRYVTDTPREEMANIIGQARGKSTAKQNTQATGLSGTVVGLPTPPLPPTLNTAAPLAPPDSSPQSTPSPVAHAVSESEIPRDLFAQSKYRIVRVLGRGGMGTVYEAEHVRMKRPVAIKVVNPELVNHPQALLRFEEEIKAVASLDHANIARAFDAENIGSLQVFVMEFVRGQTLYDFLQSRGQLSVTDACRCVRQALIGLQHAHEQGLVHRDLKPQNLMLTRDTGQIKILDFGLAKAVSENRQSRSLTSTRATMGTYAYMAPEQALDAAKADIRADIYSLGCTLYYLIAGVLPFDYETDAKLLLAHQTERPCPLHELCPDVPEALSDLVARMLAKEPAERPQTPREAADALLPFARGEAALSRGMAVDPLARPAAIGRRSNKRMWSGIAAAVIALFGFGGWAAGLFSVHTPDGTIIVENAPADADVSIDGQNVNVTRNGDSATIGAVKNGRHHLKLVQGGRELWLDDATISMAGQMLTVRFVPKESSAPNTSPAVSRAPRGMRGSWRIVGDELVADSGAHMNMKFGDPNWSDIDFAYQCRLDNAAAVATGTTRSDGHGRWVSLALGFQGDKKEHCELYFHRSSEQNKWLAKNSQARPMPVEVGRWYQVLISCRGSDFTATVDGKQMAHMKRPDFPQGCVGFNVNKQGVVRFTNIKVTAPNGAVLWEGLPDLSATSAKTDTEGFNPIFNGKDLSGWQTHPSQPNGWSVENGVLMGKGKYTHLYTERDDYTDVVVRYRARITARGDAGVIVRASYGPIPGRNWPYGYEMQICTDDRLLYTKSMTGGIFGNGPRLASSGKQVKDSPVRAGDWFTGEILVQGGNVTTDVNGKKVAQINDRPSRVDRGRIALQSFGEGTVVEFASVDVKELHE
jgi:Protein kinase domain/Domain of Unknown Function (DUF1080)